ncbi:MAG: GNAT family N-acetyltransferase [Gammaproteobacteria bacterium]
MVTVTNCTSDLRILPFKNHYHGELFDCGVYSFNEYFTHLARDQDPRYISRIFSAVDGQDNVLGFYSISAINIEFQDISDQVVKQLPAYPISSVCINQLAVDKSIQGNGLGTWLLVDALLRIYQATGKMRVLIVLVETPNERARAFYLHFGFLPLSGKDSKLFLPMDRIAQLFETSESSH